MQRLWALAVVAACVWMGAGASTVSAQPEGEADGPSAAGEDAPAAEPTEPASDPDGAPVEDAARTETSPEPETGTDGSENENGDATDDGNLETDDGRPTLRPPEALEPPAVELPEEPTGDEATSGGESFPDPEAAADQLLEGAPPSSDPTQAWSAPQAGLTLHGYFRVRGNLWDSFFLGRQGPVDGGTTDPDPPFSRFRPWENGIVPPGGCGDSPETDETIAPACGSETLGFANMRLRLEPTIALSDDVRVHLQLDIFDNVVLGSTPAGLYFDGGGGFSPTGVTFTRTDRSPRVPLGSYVGSQSAPQSLTNSLTDSVLVKRAWGEVTNRGLGQLRFGRMGAHWGLGLLWNGGDGIDSDWQTNVDRIMAVTKLAGLYFVGAYDFAAEGYTGLAINDPFQIPYDVAQDDEVDQFVFAVARRMDKEEQETELQSGGWVLNAGLQFVYRAQKLSSANLSNPFLLEPNTRSGTTNDFVRRESEAFIPDLWVQFLYGDLRLELEAVFVGGSLENSNNDAFAQEDFSILQFGFAFEGEYRLLDDQLGFYFNAGYASGDSNVEGLSLNGDPLSQSPGGSRGADNISTFRFHPNYRIDLILWRNIIGQVAGAYYFAPGISYDFIRNPFGQLFGARADFIYSRAATPIQTWGNDPNLGVEINASLYYRSEDGPEIYDGFYGSLQYGILFPMAGLGYLDGDSRDTSNAQVIRMILGVLY